MENLKIEDAIVSRRLRYICGPVEREIVVAIGKPYSPANDPTMAAQGMSACAVLTCDDSTLAYEVFGADELEALEMSIVRINDYLAKLAADPSGRLKCVDGTDYDPDGSVFMKGYMESLASDNKK